ncbi:hypothetical protein BGZ75_002737, partial [Mortierella antarctica]
NLHRDTMAAQNMCHIVREHLLHQCRPLYLQPRRKDRTYPWLDGPGSSGSTGRAAGRSSNTATQGSSQKRKAAGQAKAQSKKRLLSSQPTDPETAAVEDNSAPPSSSTITKDVKTKQVN